ncbi:MAG TPA: VacJ family lipoprotein [Thermodesulfovibrionales bacterium]|nr:VacJ family lipoprotein [Thermodesulfovibrionales bacterium]
MKLLGAFLFLMLCLLPVLTQAETPLTAPEEDNTTSQAASVGAEAPSPEKTDEATDATAVQAEEEEADSGKVIEEEVITDPFEPLNRLFFTFNDRFYFWVFKPVAKGYNAVVPEVVRVSMRNFFNNLMMPVRFVNSFLQGRVESAGIELARFGINSTIGFAGLFDIAKRMNLEGRETDTGLTLGTYGIGPGPYMILPFLGPSSLRDTVGRVGDGFLTPMNYITPLTDVFAVEATRYFNENAMRVGEYEDLVGSSIEPYAALRNAYSQHRKSLIGK